jgi:nicotinamidase-related amidase
MSGRAALVVHDVVNDFVDMDDAALVAALENIKTLVTTARAQGLPVVFIGPGRGDPAIEQSPVQPGREMLVWGTPGVDVPAMLGPLSDNTIIRKPRWGGFYGSALTEHLRDNGRDTIILCGFSLAGGITTTVRDAYNRDLKSVVVADACLCRAVPDQGRGAIPSEQVAKVVQSILAQRFARITTTAEIAGELEQFV